MVPKPDPATWDLHKTMSCLAIGIGAFGLWYFVVWAVGSAANRPVEPSAEWLKLREQMAQDLKGGVVDEEIHEALRIAQLPDGGEGAGFLIEVGPRKVIVLESHDLDEYEDRGLPRFIHLRKTPKAGWAFTPAFGGDRLTPVVEFSTHTRFLCKVPHALVVDADFDEVIRAVD
ncbi:MAG: hypothetical protein NTW19_07200 [Planctomycetota bacterium]|nr:hypothetical protein [Planctomycetota bacterium]